MKEDRALQVLIELLQSFNKNKLLLVKKYIFIVLNKRIVFEKLSRKVKKSFLRFLLTPNKTKAKYNSN